MTFRAVSFLFSSENDNSKRNHPFLLKSFFALRLNYFRKESCIPGRIAS